MNVKQLKDILNTYSDDVDVIIDIRNGQSHENSRVGLRDTVDRNRNVHVFLCINHDNYGVVTGFPHLTDGERDEKKTDILDGLADTKRDRKWAARKFTNIHGDFRIYFDHGGSQDTCYAKTYDPRLFDELESSGFVSKTPSDFSDVPYYYITDAGVQHLKQLLPPTSNYATSLTDTAA